MNRRIVSHRDRLEFLFGRADYFEDDDRLLGEWARYLCVLASGYIEESVRTIILDYVERRADPYVVRYVEIGVGQFQNARFGRVKSLLESFNVDFGKQLESMTTGEIRNAVDSVIDNRNDIAHGGTRGLSFH